MSSLVTVRVTIRHFEAPGDEWQALGDEILAAAIQLAQQAVAGDARAEVELADGSLKATTKLVGAFLFAHAVYGTIADYKGFKESVAEIAKDGREFANSVSQAIPKIVGQRHDVAAQDVRMGKIAVTAEELSDLIEQLEKLKASSQTMTEQQLNTEVEAIARRFRSIRRKLDHKDMRIVEQRLTEADLPVPRKLPRLPIANQGTEIIRPDTFEDLRLKFEDALKSAGRAPTRELSPAQDSARPRAQRRMYFKSAPVMRTEVSSRLL